MIDRDKRRRLVHLLIGINGAGFVLCGTFLSGAFKDGYVPWFGLAGIVVLFFGVVVPFYREFVALRMGFEDVERETIKTIKRRRGDKVPEHTLIPEKSEKVPFERVRSQPILAISMTIGGWALLAVESYVTFVIN